MEFQIGNDAELNISDSELTELLTSVYVTGGFTKPEDAIELFAPSTVRQRGLIYGARTSDESKCLAGIVILVPPSSKARRLAQDNEAELHLLAVNSEYRGNGLGRLLVLEAIDRSKKILCSNIVLWTQESMIAAQKLYESLGFVRINTLQKNGRLFFVYRLQLT